MSKSIYDINVKTLSGETSPLSQYKGKVMLIVNTASKCGFTPQYRELESLWQEYSDKGLVILGFPCNQFGHQEPGSEEEIGAFCEKNYGVSFPMHAKIEVNGDGEHPLYAWLKPHAPGAFGTHGIKWNFTKFLIDRKGKVVDRYAPSTSPAKLRGVIEEALAEG